jgi:hypothetical protein
MVLRGTWVPWVGPPISSMVMVPAAYLVDGVKVGSLGKGGGSQSQESGNRQSESHLDG